MYLITVIQTTFALLVATTAVTSPALALAPAPTSSYSDLLRSRARSLLARDDLDNLDFCYGENSICEQSNNLYKKCDAFSNLQDLMQWYQCICGNGYVSVTQQCHWCDDVFGLSGDDGGSLFSDCSSHSFTVAPIPTSILAIESSYNATYTGTMPAGVTLTQDGGSSPTSTSSGKGGITQTGTGSSLASHTASSSTARKTTSALSTSTFTLDGGGGATTPTAQGTTSQNLLGTPTPTGAGGSSGAVIQRSEGGMGLFIFVSSVVVLLL